MNLSTYLVSFTEVESQSYLHTIDKGLDVTTSLLFTTSSSCNHVLTQHFPCSHSYLYIRRLQCLGFSMCMLSCFSCV